MNKYEFITSLQRRLTGEVSPAKVRELTDYYSDYIDTEIRKGRSEEEVLASLGDPHLLAKSIVASEGGDGGAHSRGGAGNYSSANTYNSNTYNEFDPYNTEYYGYTSSNGNVHQVKKWELILFAIVVIVVLIAVLVLVFRILGFALGIIFKYFAPFIVVGGVVYLIYYLLNKK